MTLNQNHTNRCPNCHNGVKCDYKFCPECGYKQTDDTFLYHYTSIETLNAILNNVKEKGSQEHEIIFRATHWRFFNDPLELQFFFQKLRVYFECDSFLNKYTNSLDSLVDNAENIAGVPYIISFSKNRDDLNMWRNYSKNGTGIAIGFRKDCFESLQKGPYDFYRECDCRYLDDETIMTEFEKIRQFFIDFFTESHLDPEVACQLLLTAASFKHPCYINERERRFVLLDSTPNSNSVKYRMSNGVNIPYREIALPLSSIKEIIVGPCADKDRYRVSIKMQLFSILQLRESFNICCSELPYRQV